MSKELTGSTHLRGKGQVTIPAEIRKAVSLVEGDPLEVVLVAEGILLRPQKVIDATQAWFWDATWQRGEREAAIELEAGRGERFDSGEEFLDALRNDVHE